MKSRYTIHYTILVAFFFEKVSYMPFILAQRPILVQQLLGRHVLPIATGECGP